MGEFADDALAQVFTEEQRRADELPPGEPVHPLFDWGTPDSGSLRQECFELRGMLDGAPGRFVARVPHRSNVPIGSQVSAIEDLRASARKYRQAWRMRLGMAQQVRGGKPLSANQVRWMETNWTGGTARFVREIAGPSGEETMQILQRIAQLADRLAEGESP